MSDRTAKIVEVARKYAAAASTAWNYAVAKGDFGRNTNKCNQFVYEVVVEAGAKPYPRIGKGIPWVFSSRPLLAREWADRGLFVLGWPVVEVPQPGDVAAIATVYANATGHVAIVVGDRSAVSATATGVVLNDWGFRAGQTPTFRRHTPADPWADIGRKGPGEPPGWAREI